MRIIFVLPVALAAIGLACVALADSNVTRTLNASPPVPAGASVEVQNLVGHMRVTQGPRFQVTATVVSSGSEAQTLAQSVKLEVSTLGGRITVHVHYPVGKYINRYVTNEGNGNVCTLGIICFHGDSNSGLVYQRKQVRVYKSGGAYVPPLHVDVAVQIPAGIDAEFVNKVGLLDVSRMANPLVLDASSGIVNAHELTGDLIVRTGGGDLHVQGLKGDLRAKTGGGDAYLSQCVGGISLKTGGGDGHFSAVAGSLAVETDGGNLYVAGYTGGSSLSLHTKGGDVRMSGDMETARSLDVGTHGGDVILKVSNMSMHLDISSGRGHISVHLPDTTMVVSHDSAYSADIGEAKGRGRVYSAGGNVTVSSQEPTRKGGSTR